MSNTPQAPEESDQVAKSLFILVMAGAAAYVGVVVFFVLMGAP